MTIKEQEPGTPENPQPIQSSRGRENFSDELETLYSRNSERVKDQIIELLDASDDSILFAHRLGISYEELSGLAESNKVVSFTAGDRALYPRWQLDNGQIISGVTDVFRLFPGDIVTASKWINRNNVEFDGKSPLDLLKEGKKEEILQYVDQMRQSF